MSLNFYRHAKDLKQKKLRAHTGNWAMNQTTLSYISYILTTLFDPLEAIMVLWCFQGIETGCIGNDWVKLWKMSFVWTVCMY